MAKITTIFFDIDNTLINHSEAEKQALYEIKNKYFRELPYEKFENIWINQTAKHWLRYEKNANLFIVSEEVGFAKPNQEIFAFAQTRTTAKPTEILFIGDNPFYDIEPAIKAGWHTQLIDYFNKHSEHKSINNFTNINIESFA